MSELNILFRDQNIFHSLSYFVFEKNNCSLNKNNKSNKKVILWLHHNKVATKYFSQIVTVKKYIYPQDLKSMEIKCKNNNSGKSNQAAYED